MLIAQDSYLAGIGSEWAKIVSFCSLIRNRMSKKTGVIKKIGITTVSLFSLNVHRLFIFNA